MARASQADCRRNELCAEVAAFAAEHAIERHRMAQEDANDLGEKVARILLDHFRGASIYFPKDTGLNKFARDWEIYRRLQRGNAQELAREHCISHVRVYQIHRRCQKLKREEAAKCMGADGAKTVATGIGLGASKRSEVYTVLAADGANQLERRHHVPKDMAAEIFGAVADFLCECCGGQMLSFPKDFEPAPSEMDWKVFGEYVPGEPGVIAELADEYCYSVTRLLQTIKRCELALQKRQEASATQA